MATRVLLLLLGLSVCADPPPPASGTAEPTREAEPPAFVGASWRMESLGGGAPTEGVRPVLQFTDTPAERDTYDRPYPPRFADWRIVHGDLGVGRLHAPYRRAGDSLRIAEAYHVTRLSTDAEIAQARRLADALDATRTAVQDGDRLVLFGATGDTLAVFVADPPRPPGPLDGVEWVLTDIGSMPSGSPSTTDVASRQPPGGTRATLAFSARPLGPGPDDGFDAFGGYTGCNWHSGGYRLVRQGVGRFRLETSGPPMATERGCGEPAASVEDAMLGGLALAASVEIDRKEEPTDDGRTATSLALRDSTGTLLLAFRRHEPYPVDLGALRRGRWRFASTEPPYRAVPEGVTVAFTDSTFEARDGCYRVHGTAYVGGDDLRIESSAADESACPAAERGRVRAIPIASGKLSVTPDRLTLYDENGRATVFLR